PIKGKVGLARPSQKPNATPASAAWETVSLKNAIRLAVTKTPSKAQSGARQSVASKARIMNGSVNMVVAVRGDVNSVSRFERVGIHNLLRGTFTADHPIEGIHPRGMTINHREIVRDQDHRQMMPGLNLRDQVVK